MIIDLAKAKIEVVAAGVFGGVKSSLALLLEASRGQKQVSVDDIGKFLGYLKDIDTLFYAAKKIHDLSDTFLKESFNNFTELQKDDREVTCMALQGHCKAYKYYWEKMLLGYPRKLLQLTGEIEASMQANDDLVTPDTAEHVVLLYEFNEKLLSTVQKIGEVATEFNRISCDDADCEFKRALRGLVSEADHLVKEVMGIADKIIFSGATVMAYLHVEARRAIAHNHNS